MKTKKNWKKIAIAILWSLNIILLVFEHYQIKNLKELEGKLDNIIATKVVVTRNKSLGEKIVKASSSLYTVSQEPLLGWLEIENNLTQTAKKYGLKQVIVSSPSELIGNGDTFNLYPINMSFVGTYADALGWITTVENRFLYLDILKVSVNRDSSDENGTREVYNVVMRARLKKLTTAGNEKGSEKRDFM